MVKVQGKNTVKTEFNFYYRYIENRYMKKYIKRFNYLAKRELEEGETLLLTSLLEPFVLSKGKKKRAQEKGIKKAKRKVSETYPITFEPSRLFGSHECFDISQMAKLEKRVEDE
ncbi:hypothetical protein ELZ38_15150 [Enterococcus faecalis]|nr:hypothetical protein [Enterococcus faecalis]